MKVRPVRWLRSKLLVSKIRRKLARARQLEAEGRYLAGNSEAR